jgi:hypothetical protein
VGLRVGGDVMGLGEIVGRQIGRGQLDMPYSLRSISDLRDTVLHKFVFTAKGD